MHSAVNFIVESKIKSVNKKKKVYSKKICLRSFIFKLRSCFPKKDNIVDQY